MFRLIMGNKKIVFFKPGAIGDLLHTLPSLRALKKIFPASQITIVVSPGQEMLLEGTHLADRVRIFDKVRMKNHAADFSAFALQLRRERYDLFVDMQPSVRSRILRVLSGARKSLVYRKQKQGNPGEQRVHAAENFLQTLSPLGIHGPAGTIDLPVRREAAATADMFLAEKGISGVTPVIALNCSVGAARPSRNWFPERFSGLADRLIRETGSAIIFIGGREDRDLVKTVLSGMREKAISAAGEFSLAETAAVLARCRCLVSSDTGPLHLATAVGTPVVGLYGSTDPLRTGPVGARHVVLRKDLSCVPCEKKICPLATRACMAAITIEDVVTSVKDCIS